MDMVQTPTGPTETAPPIRATWFRHRVSRFPVGPAAMADVLPAVPPPPGWRNHQVPRFPCLPAGPHPPRHPICYQQDIYNYYKPHLIGLWDTHTQDTHTHTRLQTHTTLDPFPAFPTARLNHGTNVVLWTVPVASHVHFVTQVPSPAAPGWFPHSLVVDILPHPQDPAPHTAHFGTCVPFWTLPSLPIIRYSGPLEEEALSLLLSRLLWGKKQEGSILSMFALWHSVKDHTLSCSASNVPSCLPLTTTSPLSSFLLCLCPILPPVACLQAGLTLSHPPLKQRAFATFLCLHHHLPLPFFPWHACPATCHTYTFLSFPLLPVGLQPGLVPILLPTSGGPVNGNHNNPLVLPCSSTLFSHASRTLPKRASSVWFGRTFRDVGSSLFSQDLMDSNASTFTRTAGCCVIRACLRLRRDCPQPLFYRPLQPCQHRWVLFYYRAG